MKNIGWMRHLVVVYYMYTFVHRYSTWREDQDNANMILYDMIADPGEVRSGGVSRECGVMMRVQ